LCKVSVKYSYFEYFTLEEKTALTKGISMDRKITMRNKYVKRKYVIHSNYVLHIYVLSLAGTSNLECKIILIPKLIN